MKNITIYIIIILISLFIFLSIIYKNYIENYSCDKTNFDNNNIPEFVKKYENIDFK